MGLSCHGFPHDLMSGPAGVCCRSATCGGDGSCWARAAVIVCSCKGLLSLESLWRRRSLFVVCVVARRQTTQNDTKRWSAPPCIYLTRRYCGRIPKEVAVMRMSSAIAILAAALSVPLPAQWLNQPTPGIPRTRDGKPSAQWEHTVLITPAGHEVLTLLLETQL